MANNESTPGHAKCQPDVARPGGPSQTSDILTYALDHVRKGYSVIPLVPNSKIPAIKGWPSNACRNPSHLKRWFSRGNHNIGVVTGDRLGVLDFDDKARGTAFIEEHKKIVKTITETRRGYHVYFVSPNQEVKNSARSDHPCDVRGDGGYVVGAGSQVDTFIYRFLPGHELVSVEELPCLDPSWLPQRTAPLANRRVQQQLPATDERMRRAQKYLATITCVSGNGGHNTLYRACCKLVDLFDLNESELRALITQWNCTNCFAADGSHYPWSAAEISHKIADALAR